MITGKYREAMIQMLERKAPVTTFLSSFFKTPAENVKNSAYISVDVKRNRANYAVDIKAGTGSRLNKSPKFSNSRYAPPAYKEAMILEAEELNLRMAGVNPYDNEKKSYADQAIAVMLEGMETVAGNIMRSIEKQASDAFFNGKVVLVDGSEITYGKNETHDIKPTTKWDANGDLITDITNACQLIRQDAMLPTTTFDLIVDETVLNKIYLNTVFTERAKYQPANAQLMAISMPQGVNTAGATWHGIFSAGGNTINLWTYSGFYQIPVGMGLANEGTIVKYMPAKKGLLIARDARFDLVYAGVPRLVKTNDPSFDYAPSVTAGKLVPFAVADREAEVIKYGVESRPLVIPTEIDAFVTFSAVIS